MPWPHHIISFFEGLRYINDTRLSIVPQTPVSHSAENRHNSYVFLSYNSKDKSFVNTIAKKIKAKGVNPWTDTEDIYGEKCGENASPAKLAKVMQKAEAIVIFCGKHGLGSWQKEEVRYALLLNITPEKLDLKEKIPIVLVRLPNTELNKVSSEIHLLGHRDFISFKSVRDERSMTNLLSALQKELS